MPTSSSDEEDSDGFLSSCVEDSPECSSLASSTSPDSSSVEALSSSGHPWDEVKHDLTIALADVDNEIGGKFATSGTLPYAANPGLHVEDIGSIGLPLSERDAKELIKACHRAPFGKGTETVIDTKVRKTWELNTNQFSLRNPQWQHTLSTVVAMASKELGFVGRSRLPEAQLYKLLLYEEGAFFDRHKDTEKAPGMFGTLVIALPSAHSGGQVVAKFGGQTRCLGTEMASDYGYSYLAWYADVEHSVKPITSGFRLVLTYNLLACDATPLSASTLQDRATRVGKILERWQDIGPDCTGAESASLAYVLKHEYTQASLRAGLLKGKDRDKWRTLQQACRAQDCHLYLAQLEYSRFGGCDDNDDGYDYHEIIESDEPSLELPIVCDENGAEIARGLKLDASQVVQKKAFAGAPDDEDYSGWTGNEGVTATHFYRRACLIILQQCDYVNFVFDSKLSQDPTLRTWVTAKLHQRSNRDTREAAEEDLVQVCNCVLSKANAERRRSKLNVWSSSTKENSIQNETLDTVASASLALARPVLLADIAPFVQDRLSPSTFSELGRVITRDGLSKWQRAIETTFSSITSIRSYVEAVDNIAEGYKSACAATGLEPSDLPFLDQGIRDRVFEKLSAGEDKLQDAAALMMISSMRSGSALNQKIVPYVKTRVSQANFIMEFLSLLRVDPQADLELKKKAYSDVLGEFARQFTFDHLHEQEKSHLSFYGSSNPSPKRVFDKEAFADLLHQSLAFDVKEPVHRMLETIELGARNANPCAFQAGIFPFMRLTIQTALDDTSRSFSKLFSSLVNACIDRYIGHEPPKPQNWTKRACGCGCVHCKAMDDFLVDPNQRQMRLEKFNLNERKHLIGRTHCDDCDTEPDRRQSPHALVLTKTFKGWIKDRASWRSRLDTTTNRLRGLKDQTSIENLLGEPYVRLLSMHKVKVLGISAQGDPPSGPLIIQTKQEVEEVQSRKAQRPQSQSQQSRMAVKRPLSEAQPTGVAPAKDAKRPRLEDSSRFIDLTKE